MRHNQIVTEYAPKRVPQRGWRVQASDIPPRLLEAIRAAERRGEVPSLRELQATCGISSTSVVAFNLRRLADDGDLTIGVKGTSRSYRLTDQGRGYPSDEDMLRRCLDYLEREMGAVGGALIEDLKARLETSR